MKSTKATRLLALLLTLILVMGTFCIPASAASKSIKKAVVTVATAIYTGKTLKPTVKVTLSGKTLNSKYYTVSYSNNKNIGLGTVTVKGKNGYSGSVKQTFKIVPNKVGTVSTSTNSDTVKLSWKAVKGATTYQVYMYEGSKWVKKATTKELSAKVTGLSGNKTYSFKVRAYKKVSGEYYIGSYSSTVKATTKLAAPKNFKATAADNSIKVSWSKVSGADGYQVWLHDGTDWVDAKNTSKTSHTFSSLKSGVTYSFKVRAYINSSSKVYGSYASTIKASTALGGLSGLEVSDIDYNSAVISWDKVTGADNYIIEKENEVGDMTSYSTSKTSYTLTGLKDTTWVKVTVIPCSEATNSRGKSASITFATEPEAPQQVKVADITEDSAIVSWSHSSMHSGVTAYIHLLDKDGESLKRTELGSGNSQLQASNLESGSKYRFELRAYNSYDGKNAYSDPVYSEVFATLPGKVKDLNAITTKDRISLSWTLQSGADGYEVYNGSKELIKELTADKNVYTVYDLEEGTEYTFYVRSFIKNNKGEKVYGGYTEVSAVTGSTKLTGLSFTAKTNKMSKGETFQTEVKIEPAEAENVSLNYSSSNAAVAIINNTGTITAVSEGSTKITVSNADGSISDSFTLTVEDIKLQSVSVNSSYTTNVGESVAINPTFNPSNVSDKSFTLSGQDYTYTYKTGLIITQTKTDTCKFEDYFFVDNVNGRLLAKKATIEPKTDKAFSFTVTLTASGGKTATFKVSATKKLISVYYAGEDNPWYYGNSAKLSADVDSEAGFRADSLIWSSSDTKVATVTSDGMVNCIGTGEVTITATAPVGTKSHSITIYVREVLTLNKDYYENCKVGESYQLSVDIKPASSGAKVLYLSSDPETATVSTTGKVNFKKAGNVEIYISSDQTDTVKAVLTTGSCTLPEGSKTKLLSVMEDSANKIKTQMPALYLSTLPTFTNVKIHKEGSFKTADLVGIFESFASSQSKYIAAVSYKNYPSQAEYDQAYSNYMAAVPVSGAHYLIVPGLNDTQIRSIDVIDNGSYTYDIKLTLNDEYMANPPSKASDTAHGKVFDILENSYLQRIQSGLESSGSGMSMKYSAFHQTYNNSSLTISYNKVTGKITNLTYDMNVHVEIVDLKLSMSLITAIDSTVTFDVNNLVVYEVK